jgi:hypothetical protein
VGPSHQWLVGCLVTHGSVQRRIQPQPYDGRLLPFRHAGYFFLAGGLDLRPPFAACLAFGTGCRLPLRFIFLAAMASLSRYYCCHDSTCACARDRPASLQSSARPESQNEVRDAAGSCRVAYRPVAVWTVVLLARLGGFDEDPVSLRADHERRAGTPVAEMIGMADWPVRSGPCGPWLR